MNSRQKNPTLVQYYSGLIEEFKKYLEKSHSLARSPVHNLRVNIKKLRGLLTLLQHLTENLIRKKDLTPQLSRIFKPAGAFRNVQVVKKLASKLDKNTTAGFRRYLTGLEKSLGASVIEALIAFDQKSFFEKSLQIQLHIQLIDHNAIEEGGRQLNEDLYRQIRELIREKDFDIILHDIRKLLKIVKSVLDVQMAINSKSGRSSNFKTVKRLESRIGDWHDREVFLEHLDRFIAEKQNEASSTNLDKLRQEIENQKADLAAKILVICKNTFPELDFKEKDDKN